MSIYNLVKSSAKRIKESILLVEEFLRLSNELKLEEQIRSSSSLSVLFYVAAEIEKIRESNLMRIAYSMRILNRDNVIAVHDGKKIKVGDLLDMYNKVNEIYKAVKGEIRAYN